MPVPGQDLTQAVCPVCTSEKFIVTSTGSTLSNSFFLFFFEHQKATLTTAAEKPPVSNYPEQWRAWCATIWLSFTWKLPAFTWWYSEFYFLGLCIHAKITVLGQNTCIKITCLSGCSSWFWNVALKNCCTENEQFCTWGKAGTFQQNKCQLLQTQP